MKLAGHDLLAHARLTQDQDVDRARRGPGGHLVDLLHRGPVVRSRGLGLFAPPHRRPQQHVRACQQRIDRPPVARVAGDAGANGNADRQQGRAQALEQHGRFTFAALDDQDLVLVGTVRREHVRR